MQLGLYLGNPQLMHVPLRDLQSYLRLSSIPSLELKIGHLQYLLIRRGEQALTAPLFTINFMSDEAFLIIKPIFKMSQPSL